MSKTVIAAQLYTLREFCKTPADIAVTFKKVRAIGYEAVQASGLGPIPPQELRKIADGEGLAIIATHVAFEPLLNETPRMIEEHRILGCPNVAIGGMPRDNQLSAEGVAAFAKNADIVGARLREAGLTFSYHNHSWEFEKFNGRLIMDMIYDDTKPENVMAELDTYWVQHGGGDPAAWVEKLGKRSVLLHLKDMTVVKRTPIYAEIGEGNINWARVLKAAKAAKMKWYIVEQDTCQRDPFESLAISLKNLKAMGLK